MAARKWTRRLRILGLVVALLGAAWTALRFLPPYFHHRHVQALMREFEANSCQETADPLIELLERGEVSGTDGNDILRLLWQPKVTINDSYAPNEEISWKVSTAAPIHVPVTSWQHSLHLLDVEQWELNEFDANEIIGSCRLPGTFRVRMGSTEMHGEPLRVSRPRTYDGHVSCEYGLDPRALWTYGLERDLRDATTVGRVLRFLGLSPKEREDPVKYSCEFSIAVQVRIVSPTSRPATNP